MKKLWGIFDKRPLIWFHYVLLTGVLALAYYTGNYLLGGVFNNIWIMLGWFFVFISVGDQLIHKVLRVD